MCACAPLRFKQPARRDAAGAASAWRRWLTILIADAINYGARAPVTIEDDPADLVLRVADGDSAAAARVLLTARAADTAGV